jgi:DNA-binding PadR family transcriptional regulator
MGMDRDRLDAQLPLRPVEFHILLSLASGERHGYGIIQDIEKRGDTPTPDVGTMYRALARMAESGLIATAALPRGRDDVDERRVYYRLTDRGLRVAKLEAQRLNALARAARIGGLLEKAAK